MSVLFEKYDVIFKKNLVTIKPIHSPSSPTSLGKAYVKVRATIHVNQLNLFNTI